MVVGQGKSGKTLMLVNLIRHYKRVFKERIIVFTSSFSRTLFQLEEDLGAKIFNTIENDDGINRLEALLKFQKDRKMSDEKLKPILLVLDDFCDNKMFSARKSVLTKIFSQGRHYGISIIITAQAIAMIPLSIRKLSQYNMFYRPMNTKERDVIVEENCGWLPEKEFEKLLMDITGTKYNFLLVDLNEMRMLKNFDEVVSRKE